jgi:hypothetical protein
LPQKNNKPKKNKKRSITVRKVFQLLSLKKSKDPDKTTKKKTKAVKKAMYPPIKSVLKLTLKRELKYKARTDKKNKNKIITTKANSPKKLKNTKLKTII